MTIRFSVQSKRSHSHGGLEARATINTAGSAAEERVYWHAHTPKAWRIICVPDNEHCTVLYGLNSIYIKALIRIL